MFTRHREELTRVPESPSTPTHTGDLVRCNTARRYPLPGPATSADTSSPAPATTYPPSMPIWQTSSPSSHATPTRTLNARSHESPLSRTPILAGNPMPTRSSSLRGLRAIFKRTSGLGGSRQHAESLKERIGEPRVVSLGSVSLSTLRDAGVGAVTALPPSLPVDLAERTVMMGPPTRKGTVEW
ncbi:hypothetical protein BC834DRAFT_511036 [Gloeopeniophorella convolvens]|nr:hypothetical protein BC834DRAFT_511036 [Gloeopeniophorella convolvens]